MTLSDIAGQLLSVLLTVVLTFVPTVVHLTAPAPGQTGTASETEVAPFPPDTRTATGIFPAFSEAVRAQLRTNAGYQQAAVIAADAAPSPESTVSSAEEALVNIFCTAHSAEHSRTITGSGVFIDARGVILTNAHIAQFLLLADGTSHTNVRCVIRQGSPAISKYEAGLLYISPEWIAANAHQLNAEKPSGTGEYDFALLYVTDAFEGDMPSAFPSLAPAPETALFRGVEVRAAGYPAEILTADNLRAPLVPAVATTSITHLFTFESGTIDLVAVAPSTVGKQGSSGGPVLADDGSVLGIITTRGNIEEEGAQSVRALTLSYINRTLVKETGLTLARTLSGDIALRAEVFYETVAPHLRVLLPNVL